jgi:hypothetical protein
MQKIHGSPGGPIALVDMVNANRTKLAYREVPPFSVSVTLVRLRSFLLLLAG